MKEDELERLSWSYTQDTDYSQLERIYMQAAYKEGFRKALALVYKHTENTQRECQDGRSGGREDMQDSSYNHGLSQAIEPFWDLLPPSVFQ